MRHRESPGLKPAFEASLAGGEALASVPTLACEGGGVGSVGVRMGEGWWGGWVGGREEGWGWDGGKEGGGMSVWM